MSTHRERVLKTIRGEMPDRTACGEFFISDEFAREFGGIARVVAELDLDIAPVTFSAGWGAPAQPDLDRALEAVMRWRAESDRFVCALIDGPFSAAAKQVGFDNLMRYMRGAPTAAREAFQRGAEDVRALAPVLRDAGADGVVFGEDIAYGKTTFISPQDLRDRYFPALRESARQTRTLGLAVFFHSDGNLATILDDLAGCDLDGLQGMEPESGMQVRAVRERVGDALTLWGNLSFAFLSAPRTDAEIALAISDLLPSQGRLKNPPVQRRGSGVGGEVRYIFGSCGGLVQGLNIDTVRRVYQLVHSY